LQGLRVLRQGMAHHGQRGDLLVGLLRVLALRWWGQGEVPGTHWDQADLRRAVWVLLPERIWPSLPVGDHPLLIASNSVPATGGGAGAGQRDRALSDEPLRERARPGQPRPAHRER